MQELPSRLGTTSGLSETVNRRAFFRASLALTSGAALLACAKNSASPGDPNATPGRLTARPSAPTKTQAPGQVTLGSGSRPDGYLYVPASYVPTTPLPLLVTLHGAGGSATGPLDLLRAYADEFTFVQLSLNSRDTTWDAIRGSYGADIVVMDRSLRYAFDHCAIAPNRVYLEGFSDGATYALGVGITNGDLFSKVIAFSPGFITATVPEGKPGFFVSHGVQDPILPIEVASRRIVPVLRNAGYTVEYREFTGGHQVPADISRAAMTWMSAVSD